MSGCFDDMVVGCCWYGGNNVGSFPDVFLDGWVSYLFDAFTE